MNPFNPQDMLTHGRIVAAVGTDDGDMFCATWDGTTCIAWWMYPTASYVCCEQVRTIDCGDGSQSRQDFAVPVEAALAAIAEQHCG